MAVRAAGEQPARPAAVREWTAGRPVGASVDGNTAADRVAAEASMLASTERRLMSFRMVHYAPEPVGGYGGPAPVLTSNHGYTAVCRLAVPRRPAPGGVTFLQRQRQ